MAAPTGSEVTRSSPGWGGSLPQPDRDTAALSSATSRGIFRRAMRPPIGAIGHDDTRGAPGAGVPIQFRNYITAGFAESNLAAWWMIVPPRGGGFLDAVRRRIDAASPRSCPKINDYNYLV